MCSSHSPRAWSCGMIATIFVSVKFMTLSGFNASGCAAHSHNLLACNLMVFRMVSFDMFKSPAIWGELLSAWQFGATERRLLWHCQRHARSGVFCVEREESLCWAWAVWFVSSRYFQLTWEIYWPLPPSQGGSLHTRSCNNAACAMSHNPMNWIKYTMSNPKTSRHM